MFIQCGAVDISENGMTKSNAFNVRCSQKGVAGHFSGLRGGCEERNLLAHLFALSPPPLPRCIENGSKVRGVPTNLDMKAWPNRLVKL